ncbi:hypothetical protein SCLCIDRAFT_431929 [Scleroderma citrinum Foug A]|uniref:Uncharacterized protein n=1 Tax=Scleroderma citrinum Foug A TaxID=1036808 RepID=A0A0C2YVN1_9AGAM|nr:hypothetical protein SCLCIDRAFT_431929 [Scleroderma citrinum Foug A]
MLHVAHLGSMTGEDLVLHHGQRARILAGSRHDERRRSSFEQPMNDQKAGTRQGFNVNNLFQWTDTLCAPLSPPRAIDERDSTRMVYSRSNVF